MKKIVVIDGQGGRMGSLLLGRLAAIRTTLEPCELCAVGTNSIATSAMLKAGADCGATGQNPVIVNCRDADIIVGPIGIVISDSLQGEITAAMAIAVGRSSARKVLLPINRCNTTVVGTPNLNMSDLIDAAVSLVIGFVTECR